MAAQELTAEGVRREVETTFGRLAPPAAGALTVGGELDPPQQAAIRSALVGRHWRELDGAFLAERWASFCYLTPQAYRFYLPALLLGALERFPAHEGLAHSAVYSLAPSFWCLYYRGRDAQFEARLALLSRQQHLAVCSFLQLFFEQSPLQYRAAQALRWGWGRPDHPAHERVQAFYAALTSYERPPADDPEAQALIDMVAAAFAATPYPGDDQLCGSSQGDEPAEYALELRGHAWQRLHPDLLATHYPALSFLSHAGFRYYLPAFLVADLLGHPSAADPAFHLSYTLAAGSPAEPDYGLRRIAAFSPAERRAIVAYLERELLRNELAGPEIERALEGYWWPSLKETD
jgi:hypothetical protein